MRSKETELNSAAFRRLEENIKATYPHGQYVAFVDGEIVADAAEFDELDAKLAAAGIDSVNVFVIQAGHHYPKYAVIF